MTTTQVAIVGGGIAGLAAAWEVASRGGEAVLLEADARLGGKLRTVPLAGKAVDVGADAFLARRPEGPALAREVGLGDRLTAPVAGRVHLWVDGTLRRLPEGTVMGIPTELGPLLRAGVVSHRSVLRLLTERIRRRSPVQDDRSVGELVTDRLGREILDTLVEPLLGGVYAGDVDRLSLRATMPVVADAAARPGSLVAGLRAARRDRTPAEAAAPVFLGLVGGMEQLAGRVAEAAAPQVAVHTGSPVRQLARVAGGWRLEGDDQAVTARAVVLAVPASPAASLLEAVAPEAAATLRSIRYASVATVALAYPASTAARLPPGSGLLVPRAAGRALKAATWSSAKWEHLADGAVVVRSSLGRIGQDPLGTHDDGELTALAHAELADLVGIDTEPVAVHVARWPAALPQYEVGHLGLVTDLRRQLASAAPGLALAGAAFDGIGVAPCIGSGRAAAADALG